MNCCGGRHCNFPLYRSLCCSQVSLFRPFPSPRTRCWSTNHLSSIDDSPSSFTFSASIYIVPLKVPCGSMVIIIYFFRSLRALAPQRPEVLLIRVLALDETSLWLDFSSFDASTDVEDTALYLANFNMQFDRGNLGNSNIQVCSGNVFLICRGWHK